MIKFWLLNNLGKKELWRNTGICFWNRSYYEFEEEIESVINYQEDMGRQKTRMRGLLHTLNSDDTASKYSERSSHRSFYGHKVKLQKLAIDKLKDISGYGRHSGVNLKWPFTTIQSSVKQIN